jgi:exodeoxyribonuclease VII large subunit
VERRRLALEGIAGRLNALSPLATMARGYAVLTDAAGAPVTSVERLAPGEAFVARVQDGQIDARVERIERSTENGE